MINNKVIISIIIVFSIIFIQSLYVIYTLDKRLETKNKELIDINHEKDSLRIISDYYSGIVLNGSKNYKRK